MKKLLFLLASALLLASCAVQSPFQGGEQYFQALGEEGDIVITARVEKVMGTEFSSLLKAVDGSILERAERISSALTVQEDGSWAMKGGAEGDYPRSLVTSALDWSLSYSSLGDYAYRAKSGKLEVALPRNGLLLFSQGDIFSHMADTWSERTLRIDDSTAKAMAEADAAVYSLRPRRIPELFLEIPDSVAARMEAVLLLLDTQEGSAYISGWIKMDSTASARTLLTLFRNELIKAVRERGERLDTKLLSTYFQADGDTLRLDFPLEVFTAGKEGSDAAL